MSAYDLGAEAAVAYATRYNAAHAHEALCPLCEVRPATEPTGSCHPCAVEAERDAAAELSAYRNR